MIAAPTYPMLRDSTLRTFVDLAGDLIADFNKGEMLITLTNGAEILCRSTENPDRLRAINLDWAWLDEGGMMAEGVWPIIVGRLRAHGTAGPAWVTTTPKGFNWVYEVFGPDAPLVKQGIAQTFYTRTADNPFLSPEFVALVSQQYVGNFARQELEGAFVALDGGLFRREWFTQILDLRPEAEQWVRFWDLAASTKTGADYTVGALLGRLADGRLCLADVVRGRWEWPDARQVIIQTALADGVGVHLGVEQVAFQLAGVQELAREPALTHHVIRAVRPDKDKLARAMPWASRAALGQFVLVRGPWIVPWLAEVVDFPNGAHDDGVDAVSGANALLGREVQVL